MFEWADGWFWSVLALLVLAGVLSIRALILEHRKEQKAGALKLPGFVTVSLWGTVATSIGGIIALWGSSVKDFKSGREELERYRANMDTLRIVTKDLLRLHDKADEQADESCDQFTTNMSNLHDMSGRLQDVAADLKITGQRTDRLLHEVNQVTFPIDGATIRLKVVVPRPSFLKDVPMDSIIKAFNANGSKPWYSSGMRNPGYAGFQWSEYKGESGDMAKLYDKTRCYLTECALVMSFDQSTKPGTYVYSSTHNVKWWDASIYMIEVRADDIEVEFKYSPQWKLGEQSPSTETRSMLVLDV